jgi:hypothetical protein
MVVKKLLCSCASENQIRIKTLISVGIFYGKYSLKIKEGFQPEKCHGLMILIQLSCHAKQQFWAMQYKNNNKNKFILAAWGNTDKRVNNCPIIFVNAL